MTEVTRIARDAAYVAVGVGVIAVQKAQVRRRELRSQLEAQLAEAKGGFAQLGGSVEEQLKMVEERLGDIQDQVGAALGSVDQRLEQRVEQVLGTVQARLPEPAADLFGSAREAARDARGQLRTLVRTGSRTAAAA